MDCATNHIGEQISRNISRRVKLGILVAIRLWKLILLTYICVAICGGILVYYTVGKTSQSFDVQASIDVSSVDQHSQHIQPRWGGFDQRPMTNKCYRQERIAMLLGLMFGVLGVDQFYAHHWPLAVFKLLTLGGLGLWAFIDMILWIVGGVYGTPGCPSGSTIGWQY